MCFAVLAHTHTCITAPPAGLGGQKGGYGWAKTMSRRVHTAVMRCITAPRRCHPVRCAREDYHINNKSQPVWTRSETKFAFRLCVNCIAEKMAFYAYTRQVCIMCLEYRAPMSHCHAIMHTMGYFALIL